MDMAENLPIMGILRYVLRDKRGRIKKRGVSRNMVTGGQTYLAQRFLSSSQSLWTYYMKLDTSSTAPATVSNINTFTNGYTTSGNYISGSVTSAITPTQLSQTNQIQFANTWTAPSGGFSTINSVSLVNDNTDGGESSIGGTFARALFNNIPINMAHNDTLAVTWTFTIGAN